MSFADEGLEGTWKSLNAGNGFNMDHMGMVSKEDLRLCVTSIQCQYISICLICKKVIIEAKHVESRVGRVPAFEEIAIRR